MLVHFELPIVRLAREAARSDDLPALIELTEIVEASKSARELREASRVMGARRLHAFCATGPSPILSRFCQAVEEGPAIPHHAVVYAVGEKDVPLRALLAAWSFQSLNALCLAAPKLFRIGQDAAQRILTAALAETDIRITQSLDISRHDLGYFDPLLDLASMHHEIAHERLFIS
jgi:urease accessory protein